MYATHQAFTPVSILLISWAFRISEPNRKLFVIVLMISCGVALASHGELHFNPVGFVFQAAAVAVRPASSRAAVHRLTNHPRARSLRQHASS
jgi:drug/metabolite transporter (DMT)-like permease